MCVYFICRTHERTLKRAVVLLLISACVFTLFAGHTDAHFEGLSCLYSLVLCVLTLFAGHKKSATRLARAIQELEVEVQKLEKK